MADAIGSKRSLALSGHLQKLAASACVALSLGLGPVSLLAFAQGDASGTGTETSTAAMTFHLSGGVSHSDRLDPLPSDERVGAPVVDSQPAVSRNQQPQMQTINVNPPPPRQNSNASAQVQAIQRQVALQRQQAMQRQIALQKQQALQRQQALQEQQAYQRQQAMQRQQPGSRPLQSQTATIDQSKSSAALLQQIQQLNAHISTQGSPLAPRPQIMPRQAVPDLAQSSPHVGAVKLEGQTGRLDSMAAYKKNLQAMAVLDYQRNGRGGALQAGVRAQAPANTARVEVPFWLAGEWLRSETNESSRIELPSGKALKAVGVQKAVVDDVFGTVKDKDGRVWMMVPLRNRGSVDRGFAIDRHQVNKYELILTGKTSALVKVQASHSVVDKRTNKVIQAYQDEELNQYSLVRDGLVRTDSSVKVFDENGNPKLLTHAVSLEKRVRKL